MKTDSEIRTLCDEVEAECKRIERTPDGWFGEAGDLIQGYVPKLLSLLRDKLEAERWIPVSERLPEEDGKYLCWHAKKTPVISYFTEQTFWNDGEAQNVTHWKPISAPEVTA